MEVKFGNDRKIRVTNYSRFNLMDILYSFKIIGN